MPMGSGLSAMIRLGAALELDAENRGACMETLSIGGHPEGYALEIAGQWLCYAVAIRGEQVFIGANLA